MAEVVLVDGREALKPGALTRADAAIEIVAQPAEARYVSRGGLKLQRAGGLSSGPSAPRLPRRWRFDGWVHRCPARAGARKVYAVDVGYGQLAVAAHRSACRAMERTNMRTLTALPGRGPP
jgi:23S rRNA (cytidine1920-2'-O)/16S rRNA (cytidine1409-2'-O)-methyltransferase